MTKLTLDNWRELFHKEFVSEAFIEELLIVQKQAIKNEAVQAFELKRKEYSHGVIDAIRISEAQGIIHNL